ncbi:restriction endonuclease subunit S [Glutamicibacter protophormiae]|uniref:restriction endonuclease subunit S n=1 Tax=Glutamicibacter protophormiae TaxID=37930 RepID=UPI002A83E4CA|nr:restriction endonuclease subunit S [Glutamicibacter protophormiae]WPR65420.1 restriction endonuclease subunit S [Glutamicibacter protophormiae]WPR68918.1 restriction endonuclease subunit S [Glutamicibacter protophormiae]
METSDAYLVTGTDFKQKYIEWSRCYQVSRERYDDDPFIQLQNGDLLITKDGTIGKLALVEGLDKPACLNSGIFVLRPLQSYSTEYLHWVFSSDVFRTFVDLTSYGSTIMHLYQNVLVNFVFGVPSNEEQDAIVNYLDRETAEIDAFIADQEELIALLAERRTATITRAVTKGLEPNAPMKDSGVEWLGEVPTRWVVAPLKRQLLGIDQGVSPEASTGLADDQSVGVLKAGCVNGGTFQETQHKRLPEDFAYDSKILVNVGDLLVNRASGSPSLVGSAAIVRTGNYKLILSDKIFRLRLSSTVLPNYMEKFLNSTVYRIQVLGAISGAEGLANNLPSSALRRFLVPVPPVDEQEKITAYLDRETADIDAAITDAREAIALSQERRSAVISAAVTGKIDVRGLVAPEAKEVEDVSVGAA